MRNFAILAAAATISAAPAQAATLGQRIKQLPNEEFVFQGLNVADKVLTNHCLRRLICDEANPILGRNPSTLKLLGAGAVEGIAHAAATMVLQEHASARTVKAWEVVSVTFGVGIVAWNFRICFQ